MKTCLKIKLCLTGYLLLLIFAVLLGAFVSAVIMDRDAGFEVVQGAVAELESIFFTGNQTSKNEEQSADLRKLLQLLSTKHKPFGVSDVWLVENDPVKGLVHLQENSTGITLHPSDYTFSSVHQKKELVVTGADGEKYYVVLAAEGEHLVLAAAMRARGMIQLFKGSFSSHLIPLVFLIIVFIILVFLGRKAILWYFSRFDLYLSALTAEDDTTDSEELRCQLTDLQAELMSKVKHMRNTISGRLEEVRRAKEHSDLLLQSIAEGIIVVAANRIITSVNPKAEAVTGFKSSEVVGQEFESVFRLINSKNREAVASPVEIVLQSGKETVMNSDLLLVLGDDQEVLISLVASPILAPDGRVDEVVMVLRDITCDVLRNESLRNSNELLKSNAESMKFIFEVARIATWEFDLKNKVLYAQNEFYELLKVDETAFVNVNTDLIPQILNWDDLKDDFKDFIRGAKESTPEELSVKLSLVGNDGVCRRILCCGRLSRDESGEIVQIMRGVVIDITEEESIHEELKYQNQLNRKSQKRLEQIYNMARFYFWETDSKFDKVNGDGKFRDLMQRLCGKSKDIPWNEAFNTIQPAYREAVLKKLHEAYSRHDKTCVLEYATIPNSDGNAIFLRNYMNFEYDENGKVESSYGVIVDISKYHEDQLRMQHSSRMESIGTLAGGIAHDFNNILSGITGMVDLVEAKIKTCENWHRCEGVIEYCDNVVDLCQRADEFTRKLLSFSRKDQKGYIKVDLNEVVENTVIILRHSITKRIRVEFNSLISDAVVVGNVTEIQNAIINLGVNARDAVTERADMIRGLNGTINIRILKYNHDLFDSVLISGNIESELEYVAVEVEDNGVGIADSDIKKILEPFYTTKADEKGTGLGLAMLVEMLEAHSGALSLKTVVGQGSTFSIILPLASNPTAEIDITSVQESSENAAPSEVPAEVTEEKPKGSILVVDDEPVMRIIYQQLLEEQGYTAITAENGKEGVAKFLENRDELIGVIMDLKMPEMDGKEAFANIRKFDTALKVVFVSGYLGKTSEQELLDMGAAAVLSKPFRKRSFVKKIESIFIG